MFKYLKTHRGLREQLENERRGRARDRDTYTHHVADLLAHTQALSKSKRSVLEALASVEAKLRLTEEGRDAIQRHENRNLEELRALRRLEKASRLVERGIIELGDVEEHEALQSVALELQRALYALDRAREQK